MPKLVAKANHSIEITATKEMVPGSCGIMDPYLDAEGRIQFEYDGNGTKMFWDDQYQVRNGDHERVFLSGDGAEYLESEIELIEG